MTPAEQAIFDSLPAAVALATAAVRLIEAGGDNQAQLAALQTAAEAVKRRLDELKFPEESKLP